ncbi:MAG TPA: hypothetical protein VJ183_01550 [Chloroflexia bacterium]|nr:hypothetical protein [Chloroflexia bacterium]
MKYEDAGGGRAALENPVEVLCASPTFPDGSTFGQADLGTAGFLVYRMMSAGALWEVWDGNAKEWVAQTGAEATLKKEPLTYKDGKPLPWQGMLVAAGQKDKSEQDQYATVTPPSAHPQYAVRAYFSAKRGEQEYSGLSAASAPVSFVSMTDAIRAGLSIPKGQKPMSATQVTIFLRDASLVTIGSVDIRADGGSSEITISNASSAGSPLAQVILTSAGEIRLIPASTQKVVITGPLETEQITYQPQGGGAKQTL